MYKIFFRLLLIAVVLQGVILFFWGPEVGVSLLGIHWNLLDVSLLLLSYFAFISLPLEKKHQPNYPARLTGLIVCFLFFIPFLLKGTYIGKQYGYPGSVSYSIGIVWTVSGILIGYNARLSWFELQKMLKIIWIPAAILGFVASAALLAKFFLGATVPYRLDYYSYGVVYLFSFGLLYTFVRVFLTRNSSLLEKISLIIFFSALALIFVKKIVAPTLISLSVALLLVTLKSRERLARKNLYIRLSIVVILIISVLMVVNLTEMAGISWDSGLLNFYANTWQISYLHSDTGDILGGRAFIWREAFNMLKDRPIQGYGIGVQLENPNSIIKPMLSTHNTYLQFYLALGIFGGSIFLLLIYHLIRFTSLSLGTASSDDYLLRLILYGYFWGVLILSFFDVFTIIQTSYVLFALFSGVLLRFYVDDSNKALAFRV